MSLTAGGLTTFLGLSLIAEARDTKEQKTLNKGLLALSAGVILAGIPIGIVAKGLWDEA
jgi:hypothetical protein